MHLHVPDDIMRSAGINAGDLRIALAVQLYADNRIDHAEACRLADLTIGQFNGELLARALSIQQYPSGPSVGAGRRSAG